MMQLLTGNIHPVPILGEGRIHRLIDDTNDDDEWFTCSRCGTPKPNKDFYTNAKGKRDPRCGVCCRARQRELRGLKRAEKK